ncbi:MAG: hypothetical protein ACREU9_12530, partial [Gammaproteobacteria bacterium]
LGPATAWLALASSPQAPARPPYHRHPGESQGQGRVPERQRSWPGPKAALLGAPRTQSRGPVQRMKARLDAGFHRHDGRENVDL